MLCTKRAMLTGALALCLAACTEENTGQTHDGDVVPDGGPIADHSQGLDSAPNSDGPAGTDGTADLPAVPDLPAIPDLPPKLDAPLQPDLPPKPDLPSQPDLPLKPDLGPGGCVTNNDCTNAPGQFCALPLGCAPPGTCKVRPAACPFLYDPVCGCDNKTHSNECLANHKGVSVKQKGICGGASCTQIRADYSSTITAAKVCSLTLPAVQCTSVVTKDLACGCQTSVNSAKIGALAKLKLLEQQWKQSQCQKMPWNCPLRPCPSVSGGKCTGQSGATGGTCVDQP